MLKTTEGPNRKVAFSCVVDGAAKFEWQAYLWAHSLLRNGGVDAADLRFHCLPSVSEHFRRAARSFGIAVVDVAPFEGHPYCNKIQQCFSGAFEGYGRVVLSDCDLFFLNPPRIPEDGPFAAKVVDLPNPPLSALTAIYTERGLPLPDVVKAGCALSPDETTFDLNFNGGYYVVDSALLARLGPVWKAHAAWLINRIDLLGSYSNHVDQVAMSLALSELQIAVTRLSAESNFPVHLPKDRLEPLIAPKLEALHYHSNVQANSLILPTGLGWIDAAIAKANADIEVIIERHFDNNLFWNWRYACFPELGSGMGSRGDVLQYKKNVLHNIVRPFEHKSVLEVGCGDLETSRELVLDDYTGLDASPTAVEIARSKRPDWRFEQRNVAVDGLSSPADLVICLDVLIHQKREEEYHAMIDALVASTRERLIISGYDGLPEYSSSITAFHEPLTQSLRRSGQFSEVIPVAKYRDVTMVVANKRLGIAKHRNDIEQETLDAMLPLVAHPDLLLGAMDTSREYFGFYTQTSIRCIEYPWMFEKAALHAGKGARALDIGSGLSPLPIMLAQAGIRVDCVDSHPRVMMNEPRAAWNEWGFIDYAPMHPNLRSFHTDILEFQPEAAYDVVYSVSVVEHMPRPVWERTVELAASWLKPGGLLVLTVDMIPHTMDLWNMSEGRLVDSENHGTIESLGRKMQQAGLTLEEAFIRRNIPYSRTDVAFFVARKP